MKDEPILHVIQYFSFFSYPPSLEEIHLFLSLRISKQELQKKMNKMVKEKKLLALEKEEYRYTTPSTYKYFDLYEKRSSVSARKMKKVSGYLTLLKYVPFILLTGISGSVSMKNAKETDDIDLFIITIPNRLWLGRLSAVLLALALGMKRNRGDYYISDKICLNLFFDGSNINIPKEKQNEYVAHELLQMKPVINKYFTYENLLIQNSWVTNFFPNVFIPKQTQKQGLSNYSFLVTILEKVAKKLQLFLIKRHQTKEIVSDTQLWFYPRDFQKKLAKEIGIEDSSF